MGQYLSSNCSSIQEDENNEKIQKESAKNGNIEAMKELAQWYKDKQNYEQMIVYDNMAYDHGDPEGAYHLAQYYKETQQWFLMKFSYAKAIRKGHVKSMFELAEHYRESLEKNTYHSDKKTVEQLMYKYYKMASDYGYQDANVLSNYSKKNTEYV